MLDETGYPTPTHTLEDLARQIKQLERDLALAYSARTLENASIGAGGLRVLDGGNITISTGGTLEIITGDLILGAGKITGDALAEQIEARAFHTTGTLTPSTSWRAAASITITPPSWATSTVLMATATATIKTYARARLTVANAATLPVDLPERESGLVGTYSGSLSQGALWRGTGSTRAVLDVQKVFADEPASGTNRGELAVTAIYMRG